MTYHRDHSRGSSGATFRSALGFALISLTMGATWGCSTAGQASSAVAASPIPAGALVFDGVTVVDVEHGQLLPEQRVVIVGNRIYAVASARTVQIPSNARVVDARGKYLIPGLWDMHTHSRRYTDFFYPLFIANGVTGIRDAWSEVPLDTLILWRREILAGTRVGPPRQLLAGPALDEEKPCEREPGEGHFCVADAADARHVVDSLKSIGADFIKTYELSREVYFAVASESRRIGIPFGGHLNDGVATAIEAADSGANILDHINTAGNLYELCLGLHSSIEQCQPVADRFKSDGTWLVPTLIRFATESGRPSFGGLRTIDSKQLRSVGLRAAPATGAILRRFYDFAGKFWSGTAFRTDWLHDSSTVASSRGAPPDSTGFLRLLHSAGLPVLAGTDGGAPVMKPQPPGFALHTEIALYVAEGMTPLEALQTATLNPAKSQHMTDSLGTVAPRKLADLVLLDANPLADIINTTTIRAVVANGRYFDRAALDQLIATAQAKAKTEPRPFGMSRM